MHPSIHASIHPCIHPSIQPSIHASIHQVRIGAQNQKVHAEKVVIGDRDDLIQTLKIHHKVLGCFEKPLSTKDALQFVTTMTTLKGQKDKDVDDLRAAQREAERVANESIADTRGELTVIKERRKGYAKDKGAQTVEKKKVRAELQALGGTVVNPLIR